MKFIIGNPATLDAQLAANVGYQKVKAMGDSIRTERAKLV